MKDNSNISQELLETIERYYNDTMSKQERLDFELRLDESSEFRTQVEDIKTLILGIENQSLKEQLDVFHKDIPTHSETPSASGIFTFRKLAAAVIILLAVTGFWWFNTPQNDKLYSKYFTPDPGLPTTMSSNSNYDFYDAMVNYKQGDYQTAIAKWDAIQPKNDTLNYFLGVACLANKNEAKAIGFLNKATQNTDFPLLNDAHYYLGLAYLKDGDIDFAKKNLQKSSNENSKKILEKLD
ncbi:tetratricopeptide repeat protein [Psychroserpens algicola]|uniref:Tetratricopeptide repeat protein n=1 Tax=Psychroserpens algicola TaxID=1719034 RepID=A0ABT0H3Z6_9FLAO|nr:tetratricopeptide repeat protein [Psychroserpens algicola]MCK8479106.1 tetratricopeptide repeat protein [Psychroserpens algicola]